MPSRRALLAGLAALAVMPLSASSAFAADLPDLGGKTVVVVTENAYPPLQFVDPKSGQAIGWEYDAMNEIAKRLNFKVEYQNTSWDAMIQSVAAVLKKYVVTPGKVCRLGGDEFVLILPEQSAAQASMLAAQISNEAASRFVGGSDGITMSFGFKQAEFVAGETAETLVSVADMEMYREKNSKSR